MIVNISNRAFTFFLVIVTSFSPAAAAEADRHYETIWNIKSDPAQVGARSVVAGKPVLEQRLLPLGLAVSAEDIVSDTGKVLVEKDSQLFQLKVANGKTFCVINVPRPSFYRSFMLGGGNLQLCLVDADADGMFDGQFNGGNPMRGIPFIKGRQPKEPKKASGRYSLVDPEQFSLNYTVRVVLAKAKTRADGEPSIVYTIDFGDDQTRQSLTGGITGKIGTTSILGAEWNVAEVEENGIKTDIGWAMPDQPFQVERVVTYR